MSIKILFIASCAVLFFVIYANIAEAPPSPKTIVAFNNVSVLVDVADGYFELIRGLSGREGLKELHGMLFKFGSLDRHGIWMKDMLFPIDIIWFDESFKVVWIEKNALPSSYPDTTFYPAKPALYVLEVSAGFADKYGIILGAEAGLTLAQN